MINRLKGEGGFSLAEVLIVIALLGILASVVLVNFGNSDTKAKESSLKSNLQTLRTAANLYKSDHGFFPGSKKDDGYPLTEAELVEKLTRYTDKSGQTSTTRTGAYKYGPYLDEMPVEPFGGVSTITFSLDKERVKSVVVTEVSGGSGTGGWFYEPETGTWVANLGSDYPSDYAGF